MKTERSPLAHSLPELERLVDAVSVEEGPALLGDLERLKARLWLRLNSASRPALASPEPRKPDRLLSVTETAKMLGVQPRWVYDHTDEIPARVRLPGKVVRFSERKLERWIAQRSLDFNGTSSLTRGTTR